MGEEPREGLEGEGPMERLESGTCSLSFGTAATFESRTSRGCVCVCNDVPIAVCRGNSTNCSL